MILADICNFIKGQSIPTIKNKQITPEDIPIISSNHIVWNDFFSPPHFTNTGKVFSQPGDIILIPNGLKFIFNPCNSKFCIDRGVYIIRPNQNYEINTTYLSYWLQNFDLPLNKIRSPYLYSSEIDFLKNHKINLPTQENQNRIASALDQTKDLNMELLHISLLATKFIKNVFFFIFGDPLKNPHNWNTVPLSKIAKLSLYKSPTSAIINLFKNNRWDSAGFLSVPFSINDPKTVVQQSVQIGFKTPWPIGINNFSSNKYLYRITITSNLILPEFLDNLLGTNYGNYYLPPIFKQLSLGYSFFKAKMLDFPVLLPILSLQQNFKSLLNKVIHMHESLLLKQNFLIYNFNKSLLS
jgi:hypothetical protein